MNFLSWYKTTVESNELEPPEIIWENIQDELDVNQSWRILNRYLTQKHIARRKYLFAMAASLLILISIGMYWILKPDQKRVELQALVEDVTESEKEILKTEQSLRNQFITTEFEQDHLNMDEPANKEENVAENLRYEEKTIEELENAERKERVNKPLLTRLEYTELKFYNNLSDQLKRIEQATSKVVNTKEKIAFKKLYVGTSGQLANTWILNNKTYHGLESSSLITSKASFGSNFGIFVGTNLTKKIDLQVDLNVLDQKNQSYKEYVNGHYTENKLRFKYSQFAISGRYCMISKRFLQGEHGVGLGAYLGYLYNAYQVLDEETINLTSEYNSLDYGLFISYEYLIPIYKQLGFGTGLRAYYGLQNIYAGNEFIPSYLNETKNVSVNIGFSIRYSIK